MWRLIQSFPPFQSLSPFHRFNQHPLTIASSLALSARVSLQVSPRQFHFARVIHNTANRLVTVRLPSLLTRSDLALLSRILMPRSLGFFLAHSSVVCSSNSLSERSLPRDSGSSHADLAFRTASSASLPSSRAISTFCVSGSSTVEGLYPTPHIYEQMTA